MLSTQNSVLGVDAVVVFTCFYSSERYLNLLHLHMKILLDVSLSGLTWPSWPAGGFWTGVVYVNGVHKSNVHCQFELTN